jgi:putative ABC transport system substrate-binding protein
MRGLGYVEGRDFQLVLRSAERRYERFPELAEELLRSGIDILVTTGPATRVAPAISRRVPVVFGFSGNPVDAGFVTSFARSGGNLTGLSFMALELAAKRVELLKEVAPNVRRIGVLSNAGHPGEPSEWRVTREAANGIGIAAHYFPVRGDADFVAAFAAMAEAGCDALLTFPEALSLHFRQQIAAHAVERGIPSVFGWKPYVEAGGLISYGPGLHDGYARLATFIDRILKGAKPADLPIELPTQFELVVNLKTAETLGIDIPQSILLRADKVIE